MEVKKQSFFVQLRKLAAHLDRGKRICQNLESDGQSQTTCIDSLKGFAEELQEKLVETKKLYEDQETASVKFLSFLDLAEKVLDQQTIILQNQESFMEQYGYITYEKSCTKKGNKAEKTEEPEAVSPTDEKNASPEKTSEDIDEESPHTPKLEDFGLSHYTMLQLQKAKMSLNRPGTECVTTPTVFQHNGLFMSPGVWGKMPSLYTPDAKNTTQEMLDWQEFIVSSVKKNPFQLYSSKKIRKNLQMEMNNNDDDILNQCPSAPSLKTINLQNLNLDIYQLPPTPKSVTKMMVSKPTESAVKKPKDYLTEELPQPPNLSVVKIQASNSLQDSKTQLEVPFSAHKPQKARLVTPSPPLLHTTLNSPEIPSEPVFSCRSKKKEKINYFEKDIPEPPKLTGVYQYSKRNKENRPSKNKLAF